MCSLIHPAQKAHTPCYNVICGPSGSSIFSHISHELHDFLEKVMEYKMCVLIFSTTFVQNISHSKKNSARRYHKLTKVSIQSSHYFCQILMKLEVPRQILKKSSNYFKILRVRAELFHADRRWSD